MIKFNKKEKQIIIKSVGVLEDTYKDFQKEMGAKQEEIKKLLSINLTISDANTNLQGKLNQAQEKIKDFEQSKFKEENDKASSQKGERVIVTLGEKLFLVSVNDVIHRGSNCTELEFSNGEKQWMKKITFDRRLCTCSWYTI